MMSSYMGASLPCPPVHHTQDALLQELSRTMAESRRQSRGSNGAYTGNAMRISKPSSANNSPRNNLIHSRRRTLVNDPAFVQKAQQQMLEQRCLPTPDLDVYGNNYYEPVNEPVKKARPLTWHTPTQLPQSYQQQYQHQYPVTTPQTQYPFPSCYDYDVYAPLQMPPTPIAYSAYGSPESAFSPLVMPSYNTYDLSQQQAQSQQPQHYTSPSWSMSAAPTMQTMSQTPAAHFTTAAASCAPVPSYAEPSHSPASWTGMASAYSQNVSAPPTPEEPTSLQYAGAVMAKEQVPSSAPADVKLEDEEEGDILIGLGLYDPPEALHGSLLGASFEPTGKGLKLEDAWAPPAEDEEDDDDDDNEDDAESEEE